MDPPRLKAESPKDSFKMKLGLDDVPDFVFDRFWDHLKKLLHKKWHDMDADECSAVWKALEEYVQRYETLREKLLDDRDKVRKEHYKTLDSMLRKASKQLNPRSTTDEARDPIRSSESPLGGPAGDPLPSSARPFYDPARGSAQPGE